MLCARLDTEGLVRPQPVSNLSWELLLPDVDLQHDAVVAETSGRAVVATERTWVMADE